jgi:hypothetical protein
MLRPEAQSNKAAVDIAHAPVASLAGIDTIDSGAQRAALLESWKNCAANAQGVQDRQMQPSLLDIVGWATSTD